MSFTTNTLTRTALAALAAVSCAAPSFAADEAQVQFTAQRENSCSISNAVDGRLSQSIALPNGDTIYKTNTDGTADQASITVTQIGDAELSVDPDSITVETDSELAEDAVGISVISFVEGASSTLELKGAGERTVSLNGRITLAPDAPSGQYTLRGTIRCVSK